MAHFIPPLIQDNPGGWGPCQISNKFNDMPYQPFSKGDRLGKVSDWTGATYQDKRALGKYSSQFGGANQYAYYHEDDDSTFQLVDSTKAQRIIYQRGRRIFNLNKQRRERERRQQAQANIQMSKTQKSRELDRQRQLKKWQKQQGRQALEQKQKGPVKSRDSSIPIQETWKLIDEMDFPRLTKLFHPNVEPPEDLVQCGSMEYYDKSYDRVTTKSERRLMRINRVFHKVTTTDDPIIRQLAKGECNVFATDIILATLMCCTRSVYSWDVVVQRVGNKLFFDQREKSDFDLPTVNETATTPPQDDSHSFNSPRNLALEATYINHNFSQQVLKMGEARHTFEKPNPFITDEETDVTSVGYKYRKWDLGNDMKLVCRCEHDAVMLGPGGEKQFVNIRALNEWDPKMMGGVHWRSKLDNQRGAVLATELKNNKSKLAKWTVCSLLASSDQIKFGYVSRVHQHDSTRHVILGTQQFKPNEFASQISLNMDNAWGILRCIVDVCMKLDEGKYVIIKDPNKSVIRIYGVPEDTFESDDEYEDSSNDSD